MMVGIPNGRGIARALAGGSNVPGGNPPVGPGNNIAGSSISTNPAQATSAVSGGAAFDPGRLITLLGQTAQAIDPQGFGGRLGAVAVANQRQANTAKALAKSLAGEDLTEEELAGLTLDDATKIQQHSALKRAEEREDRALDIQEKTEEAKLLADARKAAYDVAKTIPDRAGQEAFLESQGFSLAEGVDFETRGEASIIEQTQKRITNAAQNKLNIERDTNRIAKELAAAKDLEEFRREEGKQPGDDKSYDAALNKATGATMDLFKAGSIGRDDIQTTIRSFLGNYGYNLKAPPDPNADLFDDEGGETQPGATGALGAEGEAIKTAMKAQGFTPEQIGDNLLTLTAMKLTADTVAARAGSTARPRKSKRFKPLLERAGEAISALDKPAARGVRR